MKLGILGGGQLGRMLALAAGNLDLEIHALDADRSFPAAQFCSNFTEGSFKNYDDVYQFGKQFKTLTIEIEHVNTEALRRLVAEGVTVHPHPDALDIIKDKGRQKQFYEQHDLPTAPFQLFDDATALRSAVADKQLNLPFVQKSRTAGYDGKGVAIIRTEKDLANKLLPGACLTEPLVDIDKEIAVIVARRASGEVRAFDPVEMEFHPTANLVEFLFCPANIDPETARAAEKLARTVIETFGICGLLAVEMFLTRDGQLWINEVAPRPHNSGHHSIDSCVTSQFEQHLRAVLDLPLGDPRLHTPAVMVNLLGAPDHRGPTVYRGLSETLALPGVHLHLYGKRTTKPFRKMGHATVALPDLERAKAVARQVRETLRIESA